MAEYIKREKAIAICQSYYEHCLETHDYCGDSVAYDIRQNIQGLPTADVVEVVRCGECEHFKEYPIIDTSVPSGWGKCTKINMDVDLTINDFCSYGERRCEE